MKKGTKANYLCIHGHFYQPPRENPWIEEIELQDQVGGDYHDWNERIHHECYRANAFSRILMRYQSIEQIVNNYEHISFNIGPTLMSWMAKHDPRTYQRIIEADRKSAVKFHGHGNAIAQIYNHIIMPLANRKDKITQIRWGKADFQKRFKRSPEALWLPETACDEETLEILIEEHMTYVILAPSQAARVRKIGDQDWFDVSQGNIDPTLPYRYFSKQQSGKHIDIFFYDGPISKGVSFDDLVYDAKIYADRLELARVAQRDHVPIISIATDGETYGHHKAFGDQALAYLLKKEATQRGWKITNYAAFLEKNPPDHEVLIKEGGTSWSCPHGVKRWMEHCGCRGEGPVAWRQDWRKPLRESLDWLRDELANIFEIEGSKYLKDVWAARDDYIHVVLTHTDVKKAEKARYMFFKEHAQRILSDQEVVNSLKLLEMQRNALLMYTSCGWFFTELSGIETVQIIKYAIRAVQLAEEVTKTELTSKFLTRLAKAKSNIDLYRDGRGVFEYYVEPSVVTLEKVVCHFAISSLFQPHKKRNKIYCYDLEIVDYDKESIDALTLSIGHIKVRSQITSEQKDVAFILIQSELYDFYCYVKPSKEITDYIGFKKKVARLFKQGKMNEMGRVIAPVFGKDYYSLNDLFYEEKRKVLRLLSKEGIDRFKQLFEELTEKHRRMIDVYRKARIPLPEEFRFAVEHKLSDDFNNLVNDRLLSHSYEVDKANAIRMLADELGLKLVKMPSQKNLTQRLNQRINELAEKWDEQKTRDCCRIIRVAEKLHIDIDRRIAQECYLKISGKIKNKEMGSSKQKAAFETFCELGELLSVSPPKAKVSWKIIET